MGNEMRDNAAAKAAYEAENRASNAWQLRSFPVGFVGVVVGLALLKLSDAAAVSIMLCGAAGAIACVVVSFVHIARAMRYRRAMARLEGDEVMWYTAFKATPEERAFKIAAWKRHPVFLSLYIASVVVIGVGLLVIRLYVVR